MVRAGVLGDPQTGKSSVINCFISNSFEEHVAPVIPVAVLPPEASPESEPLTLVDTSSRSSDAATLKAEIEKADVAVVVYAADRPESLSNVSSHWLPLILETNGRIPVVVVGNKVPASAPARRFTHLRFFTWSTGPCAPVNSLSRCNLSIPRWKPPR